jgi:hypothetical protein
MNTGADGEVKCARATAFDVCQYDKTLQRDVEEVKTVLKREN